MIADFRRKTLKDKVYPSGVVAGFAAAVVWILTVILIDFTLKKRWHFFKSNQVSDERRLNSGIEITELRHRSINDTIYPA
ncbi:MAG TPA: hypothetical protein VNI60_02935 [Pyrinomonadaceae bacterium]|nr:hypothetical protein [Pyrinomonadaceae bacterium]